jgi:hypothetical protein
VESADSFPRARRQKVGRKFNVFGDRTKGARLLMTRSSLSMAGTFRTLSDSRSHTFDGKPRASLFLRL